MQVSIVLVAIAAGKRRSGAGKRRSRQFNVFFAAGCRVIAPIVVSPVIIVSINTGTIVIVVTPTPFFVVSFLRGTVESNQQSDTQT